MKQQIKAGTTSKRMVIFIQDVSKNTGEGITGLSSSSPGLSWGYWREDAGNAGGTPITVASATRGTFTSGGFVEIDSSTLPGFYEIGIPNAVLASTNSATWAVCQLQGALNMAAISIEFQLVYYDPNDSTRLGLSAIPNGPTAIKKNQALNGVTFAMFTSAGAEATGLTVTAQRSIDGGSLTSCSNSVTELSNGIYKIDLTNTDLNGTVITFRMSATGALSTDFTFVTQA
jgi:hypothetical protein